MIRFVIEFLKQVGDALTRALCECISIRDQRLKIGRCDAQASYGCGDAFLPDVIMEEVEVIIEEVPINLEVIVEEVPINLEVIIEEVPINLEVIIGEVPINLEVIIEEVPINLEVIIEEVPIDPEMIIEEP